MTPQKFSLKKRLLSFRYAFRGIKTLLADEHNSWIHTLAAMGAIGASIYFNISSTEWIAVLFAIGFVFAMEMVNSALENLADFVSPEKHELIKKVKDLAAGAVLFSALTALAVGLIVFLPKILR